MVIERESFGLPKRKKVGFEAEPVVKEEKVDLGEFVEELVSIINKRFSDLEKDIRKIKTDVASLTTMETDISKLRSDIRGIRTDVTSLKATPKLTLDKKALKGLKK